MYSTKLSQIWFPQMNVIHNLYRPKRSDNPQFHCQCCQNIRVPNRGKFPGGGTRMSRGYQTRPKIHEIRVVFQDQALYVRTSFRGAKTCKIGKKGCVFGHIDKFWKGHDGQIKINACKNAYLGSVFIPEKYVIRVLFVCPWMSLIPPLAIWVAPQGKIGFFAYGKWLQSSPIFIK